jgi:ABC-2 type transport system permease protein
MKAFWALFKHEVSLYFNSPIAYVVIVIFAILSGWFYTMGFLLPFSEYCERYPMLQMQMQQNPMMAMQGQLPVPNFTELIIPGVFGTFSIVLIFMVPLLTMRSIAEEKRQGTIELLYTYPLSDLQVVLSKYAASLVVFILLVALVSLYLLIPDLIKGEIGGVVQWKTAGSAILGFFLLGATSIALGFVFSAFTENQIVAAALTFTLLLFLWVVGWAAEGENLEGIWKTLAQKVSLTNRSADLYKGLLHLSDLVFFGCVTVGSLFITMRSLESHRWRS